MRNLVMIIGLMLLLKIILVVYIWPYRISPNPDRPLTWYYPCVCGCLRGRKKKQVKESSNIATRIDEESGLIDAEPPLLSKLTSVLSSERN